MKIVSWLCLAVLGICINLNANNFALTSPTTINEPGFYVLNQDVEGTIIINASNVTINLNGHTISETNEGISVNGQSDIHIFNGIIQDTQTNAINILTCTNVSIDDIEFIGGSIGIFSQTVTGLSIEHCSFRSFTSEVIRLENTHETRLNDCFITHNNCSFCIFLTESFSLSFNNISICNNVLPSGNLRCINAGRISNTIFSNIIISHNRTMMGDLTAFNISRSNDVACFDCIINENESVNNNFGSFRILTNSHNVTFNRCRITNNIGGGGDCGGFDFNNAQSNAIVNDCEFSKNTALVSIRAFQIFGGFTSAQFNKCLCNNNTALTDDFFGFFCSGGKNIIYTDCHADGNTINKVNNALFRFDNNAENIEARNCSANGNSSTSTLYGFWIIECNNAIFSHCLSNANTTTAVNAGINAFFATGSTAQISTSQIIFDSCVALANSVSGGGELNGFFVQGARSCIINSLAKGNTSVDQCTGFQCHGVLNTVRNNTAIDNKGSSSFGFLNAGTNNVFLENEAQNHGVNGATNYLGVPAPFITTLDPTTDWTSTVTPYNNISVTGNIII